MAHAHRRRNIALPAHRVAGSCTDVRGENRRGGGLSSASLTSSSATRSGGRTTRREALDRFQHGAFGSPILESGKNWTFTSAPRARIIRRRAAADAQGVVRVEGPPSFVTLSASLRVVIFGARSRSREWSSKKEADGHHPGAALSAAGAEGRIGHDHSRRCLGIHELPPRSRRHTRLDTALEQRTRRHWRPPEGHLQLRASVHVTRMSAASSFAGRSSTCSGARGSASGRRSQLSLALFRGGSSALRTNGASRRSDLPDFEPGRPGYQASHSGTQRVRGRYASSAFRLRLLDMRSSGKRTHEINP